MATDQQLMECSLSSKEFSRLKDVIHGHCGIKITDAKRTMLETRLRKRLKSLGFKSFAPYCTYLFSAVGMQEELTHMIDQVTTNKTDFFREPTHFDYLSRKVLPELASRQKMITVWSAGCSTGEEPYTLAMVLREFTRHHMGTDFIVLATDISTRVLEKAKLAVYDEETVAPVPAETKRRYLLRGKGKAQRCYRVKPELRHHVQFEYLNLMDSNFAFVEQMDIIFCRNVIIYFDKSTQGALLHRFCRHLSPHGHLFMGHSETLFGMDLPLKQVAPTVYRKMQ